MPGRGRVGVGCWLRPHSMPVSAAIATANAASPTNWPAPPVPVTWSSPTAASGRLSSPTTSPRRAQTCWLLVNRAQFDNSNETCERIRERTPAVRAVEHTIEYLDLVGSCHGFVATLDRLVPQLRGQEFTEDERETVRRQIGRVRAAADWLEGALDNGEFTLDVVCAHPRYADLPPANGRALRQARR
ncbi:DUF6192 family protein [Streptomyces cacaoi]